MISPPQPVQVWFDTDNLLRVSMSPSRDITGWTLSLEIYEDGVGVFGHKTVFVENVSSGVITSVVSPDLDGLDSDKKYHFRFLRTNFASRDVVAWGPLPLRKLS